MKYTDKQANNILLIDIHVPDYQQVVDSVNSNTLAIVYDYTDTYEDLSNILQNYDISRVGIVFESPSPFLNGSFFETTSLMIDLINHHKIPHIDYLACNTLNNPEWVNYYKQLPCIVGASNNETGNVEYGGDWIMESTGENIEFLYFTDIKLYKYLLAPNVIQYIDTANNQQGLGVAVMKNTNTNTIVLHGTARNNLIAFNYSTSSQTNLARRNITISNTAGTGGMAVYTSRYSCPTSAFIPNPSNDYLLYIATGGGYIRCIYDISMAAGGGQIVENQTFITTVSNTFTSNNYLCIHSPTNTVYFTTGLYTVGRAIITDSSANGLLPTVKTADISTNYLSTTTLGTSSTMYPTGITCDASANLYIVMGNTTTSPPANYIVVYNSSGIFSKKIDISTVFNPIMYGFFHTLEWKNNILYIGTYKGEYTNSYTGAIIGYNTIDTTNIFLQCYANGYNHAGGLFIYNDSILSVGAYGTGFSGVHVSINIHSPLNTASGFRSIKNNYLIDIEN
jgi:hypothetical protein